MCHDEGCRVPAEDFFFARRLQRISRILAVLNREKNVSSSPCGDAGMTAGAERRHGWRSGKGREDQVLKVCEKESRKVSNRKQEW